jgi:hypothetical protein
MDTERNGLQQTTTPPPHWVRSAVRGILDQSPGYGALSAEDRRSLAHTMVKVSALAAQLIGEEADAQQAVNGAGRPQAPPRQPLARAQDTPGFAAAAAQVAVTTQAVLNAVSFPRFVTDLINGVFKAMLDSSSQQMHQYVELLNNVSASLGGFAETQFSLDYAKRWLADKFPENFQVEQPDRSDDPENTDPAKLVLRPSASMPSEDALRTGLGMEPDEPLDAGSLDQLVPLARRQIARQRQQMLSTMVMLGMQRIVVDSGRITASMRFHIDTRSAANQEQGSTFSEQNRVKASGGFSVGPWGVSAEVENNLAYVSTQKSQNTEEMNTDLDLNSSVELNFRSDYLPLNRMAAQGAADRIRANALNPDAEAQVASQERIQRQAGQRQAERDQMRSVDDALKPPGQQPAQQTAPQPAQKPAPQPAQKRPQIPAQQPVQSPGSGGGSARASQPAANPAVSRSPQL